MRAPSAQRFGRSSGAEKMYVRVHEPGRGVESGHIFFAIAFFRFAVRRDLLYFAVRYVYVYVLDDGATVFHVYKITPRIYCIFHISSVQTSCRQFFESVRGA